MRSPEQTLGLLKSYRSNLERYARDCLKIRDKTGSIGFFPRFNSAQRYAHDVLENQRHETGKVRALILKGRQQGISTYIAARFYHRAALFRGVNVYILSHEQSASDNLFKIVDRFQTGNPIRPHTGISNVKELEFDRLDSSYSVATAGQKAAGRSKTTSLFHGSEVAFWQNAADHFAASVQTVPDMEGTEIILESTGNGASGEFYERWQDAMHDRSDYLPVFIPWFWQEEYCRRPPKDFQLSEIRDEDTGISEAEYAVMFDLSMEQMAWRRAKIGELRSVRLFDQEYPASPEMAFTGAHSKESFIAPSLVLRARKRKGVEAAGAKILGVDPASDGGDRFSVTFRQGPKVHWVKWRNKINTLEGTAWIRGLIDDLDPDRAFIDAGHIGRAIITNLKAIPDGKGKYRKVVRAVNFGGRSQHKMARPKVPGPRNRRAEMWERMRDWLQLEEGVSLPDLDVLQADMTAPKLKPLLSNDFLLESKREMKARGVRSPDTGDSTALTFAEVEHIVPAEQSKKKDKPATPEAMAEAMNDAPIAAGGNSWMGY